MAESIIRVSNLTYYYRGQDHAVLQDVNLEIRPGEFVLLIGPSGCGKSTLALSLNGIIPTVLGGRIKGRVYVGGRDTRTATVHDLSTEVGIVFQDPESQLCNLYVEEEVGFGPSNLLLDREEVNRRVDRALSDVGQQDLRRQLIYELSGGQKQRVAIASVLAMEPSVLVFDEPTANLDPLAAVQIFELIRKINQESNTTVVVIEHNVDAVMPHADRLIVMKEGTIAYDEKPRDLMRDKGRFVLDVLGLRIPQVCELGVRMEEKGLQFAPFPLDSGEAASAFGSRSERIWLRTPAPALRGTSGDQEPVIETHNLSFSYGKGTQAVKDVSLCINRGRVVGILGENGSGKTTLSSLLVGLNRPSAGGGTVCGLDIATASIRELASKVGYVFQYPEHQFVEDSVWDEVAFGLKAQKRPREEVSTRVRGTLELLRLQDVSDKHPLALSMGQKRRLSVATMLALDPEILVLDEPTTGQDRGSMDNIMRIMMDANRRGTTVLLITHDMNLVAKYCDEVVVMDKGEIIFSGAPLDLCRDLSVIRSGSLVLPEIYQLAQILHATTTLPLVEILTVDDFVDAVEVR